MLAKYHEDDDIFTLKFMPPTTGTPDLEVTVPISHLRKGQQVRFTAPSKNLDRRCSVLSIEKIREDSGHLDVVQAAYID